MNSPWCPVAVVLAAVLIKWGAEYLWRRSDGPGPGSCCWPLHGPRPRHWAYSPVSGWWWGGSGDSIVAVARASCHINTRHTCVTCHVSRSGTRQPRTTDILTHSLIRGDCFDMWYSCEHGRATGEENIQLPLSNSCPRSSNLSIEINCRLIAVQQKSMLCQRRMFDSLIIMVSKYRSGTHIRPDFSQIDRTCWFCI